MTMLLLSAALIAAAMLTTPVVARENHPNARHLVRSAHYRATLGAGYRATLGAGYIDRRFCYPAPRVGAFATQPWDTETPCEPAPGYY
jgi:hypothetical protein